MLPADWDGGRNYRHVSIVASVYNQAEFDRDLPRLIALKSHGVRCVGLSIEPQLGPISIIGCPEARLLDWVINGGDFTFGSGAATTLDVYLQTSFDGGTNWCDVVHFAQFTTASARAAAAVVQGAFAPAAVTDGTLAAGTANAGLFGPWWRVKYTVVGAYTATTIRLDAFANVGIVPAGVNAFN